MPAGIKFSYNYLNVPITLFVAYNVSGSIYYTYYYVDIAEISNLTVLIPKQVDIIKIYPASVSMNYNLTSWTVSPGVPLQDINVYSTNSYFDIWTTPATVVEVNGSEWVHNITGYNKTSDILDSAITGLLVLVQAPPTPEITTPDDPPQNASITISYPNNSVTEFPIWTLFPATNYTGFPAVICHDNYLPAYLYVEGMPTNAEYLWATLPTTGPIGYVPDISSYYSYNYEGWGGIGNWGSPLTNFQLTITPNGSIIGTVQGISPPGISPSNIIFAGTPNGNWQLAGFYPIYAEVPEGVHVENIYLN